VVFVVLIRYLVRFLVFGHVLQIDVLEIIRTNVERFHYSFLRPRELRPLARDNLCRMGWARRSRAQPIRHRDGMWLGGVELIRHRDGMWLGGVKPIRHRDGMWLGGVKPIRHRNGMWLRCVEPIRHRDRLFEGKRRIIPVGAGAEWMRSGDACVAQGEGGRRAREQDEGDAQHKASPPPLSRGGFLSVRLRSPLIRRGGGGVVRWVGTLMVARVPFTTQTLPPRHVGSRFRGAMTRNLPVKAGVAGMKGGDACVAHDGRCDAAGEQDASVPTPHPHHSRPYGYEGAPEAMPHNISP
jgi:hypothetical protein